MEIREIRDKEIWEDFLGQCQEKTFLQSWNWSEFQQKMGHQIWRFGIFDNEELIMIALVSKITAKRGTFLLIQHGPAFVPLCGTTAGKPVIAIETLINRLKEIAKQEKAVFVRISPLWENNQENQDLLKESGLREAPMHANAYEATWQLDLQPAETELLAQMRKTTRYLIRQAQKNQDIVVEKSQDLKDIEAYQALNKQTAKRQKFTPFSSEHIKNEYEIFLKDNQATLFFGKYKGEIICGALIIFWSGIGFYHQAASSGEQTKLPIPYLVQWEAIKEAKNRGCRLYDFWGYTDPQKYPKHPWAGPTLFKMGFGGQAKEYVKTQDLVFSPQYWLTYIFEKARKLKRGF